MKTIEYDAQTGIVTEREMTEEEIAKDELKDNQNSINKQINENK